MRERAGRSAIAVLALVSPTLLAASSPQVLTIAVTLSPAARHLLATSGEAITVSGAFYGDPSTAGESHADQIGQIALLNAQPTLPASGGIARFPLAAIPPAKLRWIAGPTMVNVNVYSARRHFRDNVLSCDFLDGRVPDAARMPIRLNCGLIRENPKTRAIG